MIIIFREEKGVYSLIEVENAVNLKLSLVKRRANELDFDLIEKIAKKMKRYCDECNLETDVATSQALIIDIKYRNLMEIYTTEIDTDILFDLFDKSRGDACGNINVIKKYIWNSACQYEILKEVALG